MSKLSILFYDTTQFWLTVAVGVTLVTSVSCHPGKIMMADVLKVNFQYHQFSS